MPSKNYNGNNPLGRRRIKTNGLDTNGALARVEAELGRLQPSLSLQTGSLQLPNGRVQVPRKTRRGGGGGDGGSFDHPWKVTDESETIDGVWTPKININRHTLADYRVQPPNGGGALSSLEVELNSEEQSGYIILSRLYDAETETYSWTSFPTLVSLEDYDEIETMVYLLAKYTVAPVSETILITQYAYSRLGLVTGCLNGEVVAIPAPV